MERRVLLCSLQNGEKETYVKFNWKSKAEGRLSPLIFFPLASCVSRLYLCMVIMQHNQMLLPMQLLCAVDLLSPSQVHHVA
jgi:hypothetical protein